MTLDLELANVRVLFYLLAAAVILLAIVPPFDPRQKRRNEP